MKSGARDLDSGEFITGAVSRVYAPDVNRYVPDPLKQFVQLKDHGDYYGFYTDAGHLDTFCESGLISTNCQNHWQGLARLVYPETARAYFLVASSHSTESRLAVVNNGEWSGLRLRGNRHDTTRPDWEAPPDWSDRIVLSRMMQQSLNHPGGMQVIGQYVAVGLEKIASPQEGAVYLYDVSRMNVTTKHPIQMWSVGIAGEKVATASVVKLAPFAGERAGRYLMLTLGGESKRITFNISRAGKMIDDPKLFNDHHATTAEGSIAPAASGVANWTDMYQTMQIIVDPNGQLYLLGATKDRSGGSDYLDLFALRLRLTGGTNQSENTPLVAANVTHLARKIMYCIPSVSNSMGCDFSAAGGAYIDPDGRLYYYATVHSDSPLNGASTQWTRMMEFRPRDHLDEPDTSAIEGCPALSSAWVNFYDGKLGRDSYSSSAPVRVNSFMIDFVDRRERAQSSFGSAYNFNDRVVAVQFCIPRGHRFRLFEHENFRGASIDLVGTGSLATKRWGNSGARQKWSSGCFIGTANRCL